MGSHDRVTPPGEVTPILAMISQSEHVIIQGALHDVMNELEIYRKQAWAAIDAFLRKINLQ